MGSKSAEIFSMTGFGRGSVVGQKFRVTAELRSVNGRFLEIRAKLPRTLSFLEPLVREILEKSLNRGMIDLTLNVQTLEAGLATQFDGPLARAYSERANSIAEDFGISSGLTALALLKLPGVMGAENPALFEAEAEVPRIVGAAVEEALSALVEMRRREGEKLTKVLQREFAEVKAHREWIHGHREEINERYARKLQSRIKDWMGKSQAAVDENRLNQEVAYYLDRSDVTEELDRLASHLKQCEEILLKPTAKSMGKRLEFLSQELGREVNTIGSKSDHSDVTNHVVEMKLTLEKIREQVQNLE